MSKKIKIIFWLIIFVIIIIFINNIFKLRYYYKLETINISDIDKKYIPNIIIPQRANYNNPKYVIGDIPIYWINLDRSLDRKQQMLNQFKKYDINNHHRIIAIDANNINEEYKSKKCKITIKEYACLSSHCKAIETAYNNNDEFALIMEDDCSFEYLESGLYIPLSLIIDKYKEFDIIQLCFIGMTKRMSNKYNRKEDTIIGNGHYFSACAYLISKNGMKNIINAFKDKNKILTPADWFVYENNNVIHTKIPYFTHYYFKSFQSTLRAHNNGEDISKYQWDSLVYNSKKKMIENYKLFLPNEKIIIDNKYDINDNISIKTFKNIKIF